VNNIAQKQRSLFYKLYDKFIRKNVSCFITASQQAKEMLAKERKFDFAKIRQIPNTIMDEIPSVSRKGILEALSIKESDFILCTVGFLSNRKGQKYLIDALHLIRSNYPDVYNEIRLLLVGDGEEGQYLKNHVKGLGIAEHVYFLGYQKHSVNYIDACDLFVLPSIAHEDMPLAVLTAMSKGKTILATDFSGIREEIEEGVSGVLVSPNICTLSESLSGKIVDLFRNPNISYGIEAQKRFNKLFSSQVYGHSIVDIYNNVTGQYQTR
jgi:glycosyltransferase involved in cell wall biosynthesis